MRKLTKFMVFVLLPLAIAYAAWPVHSALEIREAVVAGDTATLNRKVEWEALRASLKSSITPETIARLMADPDAPTPTLWQRIKAAVAPSMADNVINRYVTPEHLPVLLGYRRVYRGSVRPALGLKEPPIGPGGHMARRYVHRQLRQLLDSRAPRGVRLAHSLRAGGRGQVPAGPTLHRYARTHELRMEAHGAERHRKRRPLEPAAPPCDSVVDRRESSAARKAPRRLTECLFQPHHLCAHRIIGRQRLVHPTSMARSSWKMRSLSA